MKFLLQFFLSLVFIIFPFFVKSQTFSCFAPTDRTIDFDIWDDFEWTELTLPKNFTYTIQFSINDPTFPESTTISFEGITGTSIRPPVDLIINTRYYWRVLAVTEDDEIIYSNDSDEFTQVWRVTTITESTPREINGSTPLLSDRTLIKENNPYHLTQADLDVPENISFKLNEGVQLLIDGDYSLIVSGEFQTLGTEDFPIEISSNATSPAKYDWGNIQINANAENLDIANKRGSIFNYTDFSFGGSGNRPVIESNSLALSINNCNFQDFSVGIYVNNADGNVITNNHFSKFKQSSLHDNDPEKIGIVRITGNNNQISHNTINEYQFTYSGAAYVTFKGLGLSVFGNDNNISDNYLYGVTFWNENNEVDLLGGGMYVEGDNNSLINNHVTQYAFRTTMTQSYRSGPDRYDYFLESYVNPSSYYVAASICGLGIYMKGNNAQIEENRIDNGVLIGESNENIHTLNLMGIGIFADLDNSSIINNEIDSVGLVFLHNNSFDKYLRQYGMGAFVKGDQINFSNNSLKGNRYLDYEDASTSSYSSHYYGYGGGLYLDVTNLTFDNNELVNNCNINGGGIYSAKNININNSIFQSNTSAETGGGIHSQVGIIMTNSSATDNYALKGAGLFANTSASIANSLFSDNKADKGAGIYSKSTLNINGVKILGNTADSDGGGIWSSGAIALENSVVSQNTSTSSGGGIFATSDVSLIQSTLTYNSSTDQGAAIYSQGLTDIQQSIIRFNESDASTGGVFGDITSIQYSSINKNSGFEMSRVTSLPANTDATNNWWYTYSDVETIGNESIYDGNDTGGTIGFVDYQPILTDVPDGIPGKMQGASSVTVMLDSKYETPSSTLKYLAGDTVYVVILAADLNPYNKDVAIFNVLNESTFDQIDPYFDETQINSGVWHGFFVLSDKSNDNTFEINTEVTDFLEVSIFDQSIKIQVAESQPLVSFELDQNYINENSISGTLVGALSANDPDETDEHTFEIISGEFTIEGNKLFSGQTFDYEETNSQTVTIKATDRAGNSLVNTFEVIIQNINEPPSLDQSIFSMNENSPEGTVIGQIMRNDLETDILTYSIISGNGLGAFTITTSGELVVANSSVFDFESITEIKFIVSVSDGEFDDQEEYTIKIENVNEAPSFKIPAIGNEWTEQVIRTSANRAYSVYSSDLDGDGDIDVLSASYLDNKIAWYQNDGNGSFTSRTISTSAVGAYSVYSSDLDGDGDMDVLSASNLDDKIAW
ncbi:MAG: VCBS repeat-containing protein, partial [Cyclobacteriaceae bacterium]